MRVSIVPRYFCVTKGLTAALIEQLHGVGRDGETLANVGIATKDAVNVVGERAELILVDSVLGAGASSALDGDTTLVSLETAYVSSIGQLFRSHSPPQRLARLGSSCAQRDLSLLTQDATCCDGGASGAGPSPQPRDGQMHRC